MGTTIEKTNVWLGEVAEEMAAEDRQTAYRGLRGFLHVLRDRLPDAQAAHLAAQLPMLLRGIYYEGWSPGATESYRDVDVFLQRVADRAELAGTTEASLAVEAAARVVRRHVTPGLYDQVLAVLPEPLRPLVSGEGG